MRVPSSKASRTSWVTKTMVFFRRSWSRLKLALDFRPRQGVERSEGLVHQQDRRVTRQGARHSHALPLAAGKLARVARKKLPGRQSDKFQHLAHPRVDFLRRPVFQLRHQANISFHREVREQPRLLDDIADAPTQADGIPLPGRDPFNLNVTGARFQQPVDELERGGFAGPAAAQEHQSFTPAHTQGQVR